MASLLVGDYDPDGNTLSLVSLGRTASGRAKVTLTNGNVFYDPQDGFTAADSFIYQFADSYGALATATVTVNVLAAR